MQSSRVPRTPSTSSADDGNDRGPARGVSAISSETSSVNSKAPRQLKRQTGHGITVVRDIAAQAVKAGVRDECHMFVTSAVVCDGKLGVLAERLVCNVAAPDPVRQARLVGALRARAAADNPSDLS